MKCQSRLRQSSPVIGMRYEWTETENVEAMEQLVAQIGVMA